MDKILNIIILNWNGLELLRKFLPPVVRYSTSPGVGIIVADNASTDGSADWVAENYPDVKIIRFDRNHGFAEGYNLAIKETGGKYTLLLNSDVEVEENWWQPLFEFMEEHPEAGACQPKIRSWHDKKMFEYAGAAGGYLDNLGYPYCRGRLFDSLEEDRGQYDGEPVEICWASGAALMVRNEAYLSCGGLDPLFFAHMEEIDLCCRMQGAGWKVYAVSDSKVFHVGGASLNQGNPKKTYLNFRNNLLLLHKNLPSGKRGPILFVRRLVDTLAMAKFLLSGDIPNLKAVWKAHMDFREMKKNYTSFPDRNYMKGLPGHGHSAIIEHYLLGHKSIKV